MAKRQADRAAAVAAGWGQDFRAFMTGAMEAVRKDLVDSLFAPSPLLRFMSLERTVTGTSIDGVPVIVDPAAPSGEAYYIGSEYVSESPSISSTPATATYDWKTIETSITIPAGMFKPGAVIQYAIGDRTMPAELTAGDLTIIKPLSQPALCRHESTAIFASEDDEGCIELVKRCANCCSEIWRRWVGPERPTLPVLAGRLIEDDDDGHH